MKILYPNSAAIVSVSSAQDNAPGYFAINRHLHTVWRPSEDDSSPEIIVRAAAEANAVYIDNITASSVTVTVRNSDGTIVKSENFDLTGTDSFGAFAVPRIWMDYDVQESGHTVTLALTKGSAKNPGVGMIFTGRVYADFPDPEYGIGGSPSDHSVKWNLDKGYRDTQKGNQQRNFSNTHRIRDPEQFHALLRKLTDAGSDPCAWKLSDGAPEHEWLIYGDRSGLKWSIPKYRNMTVSYTIEEFL